MPGPIETFWDTRKLVAVRDLNRLISAVRPTCFLELDLLSNNPYYISSMWKRIPYGYDQILMIGVRVWTF